MTNNGVKAEMLVFAMRYPPNGARGLGLRAWILPRTRAVSRGQMIMCLRSRWSKHPKPCPNWICSLRRPASTRLYWNGWSLAQHHKLGT